MAMHRRLELTGQVFGRLTVLGFSSAEKRKSSKWSCRCACGESLDVLAKNLRNGHSQSCGSCFRPGPVTHGMSSSSEYHIWSGMLARCGNSNSQAFGNYGGRGITVCDSWQEFEVFYRDMGIRPSRKHTLDRRDNSLGYSKANCRWATYAEQMSNKRSNVRLTHESETRTMSQWALLKGMRTGTLHARIKKGWTVSDAIDSPVRRMNLAQLGETHRGARPERGEG